MEKALRASEARYRALFERNLAGVYRSSLEGQMLECNLACARMLGFESPQAAALCDVTRLYVDPEARRRFVETLQQRRTVTDSEMTLKRRDGTTFLALVNAALVPDSAGGMDHIEGCCSISRSESTSKMRGRGLRTWRPLPGSPRAWPTRCEIPSSPSRLT